MNLMLSVSRILGQYLAIAVIYSPRNECYSFPRGLLNYLARNKAVVEIQFTEFTPGVGFDGLSGASSSGAGLC